MPIIHDVEQKSPEWHNLRMGRPTASSFDKLITTTGKPSKSLSGYAIHLAAELYIGRPVHMWAGNAWSERGKELEDHAVRLYEFATDADVRKVGFVTTDDGAVGASPDGLIGDDGMIEVKCLSVDNHIAAILHYKETGTAPADYIQQTQGQMMICERAWCDLVFYSPDLPLLTIRQTPIEHIVGPLKAQIPAVIAERDSVLATLRSISKE